MQQLHPVTVSDVNMPFWSMVRFLVKLAFASIPAMIVVWAVLLGLTIIAGLALSALGIIGGVAATKLAQNVEAQRQTQAENAVTSQAAVTSKGYKVLRQQDFGDAWPLSVNQGRIWCEPGGALLFVSGTKVYAVNQQATTIEGGKYPPIDGVWKIDDSGAQKDLTPLINAGQPLCVP